MTTIARMTTNGMLLKNPTDASVSDENYSLVHKKMRCLFANKADTTPFKQMQNKFTPSWFASLRTNKYKIIEAAKDNDNARSVDLETRKLVHKALFSYTQYGLENDPNFMRNDEEPYETRARENGKDQFTNSLNNFFSSLNQISPAFPVFKI